MATTPNVPTLEQVWEDGLRYAKESANNMLLHAGEVPSHVTVFMRNLDTQQIAQVVVPFGNARNDTPTKRKQELYNAGRYCVRKMRAGLVLSNEGVERKIEVPELDFQHPLLTIYMAEVWYLDARVAAATGKRPRESDKRKEAVLMECLGADARYTFFMADIRRTKRGKPLPLVFDDGLTPRKYDQNEAKLTESTAALFLMGMREEVIAGHRLN